MSDVIKPKGLFQAMIDNMPARFFEIYNAFREQGYEHRLADIKAWAVYDSELREQPK